MLDSRIRNADENRSMVGFQRRSERLSRKKADNRADNRYIFPLKSGLTIGEKS